MVLIFLMWLSCNQHRMAIAVNNCMCLLAPYIPPSHIAPAFNALRSWGASLALVILL